MRPRADAVPSVAGGAAIWQDGAGEPEGLRLSRRQRHVEPHRAGTLSVRAAGILLWRQLAAPRPLADGVIRQCPHGLGALAGHDGREAVGRQRVVHQAEADAASSPT